MVTRRLDGRVKLLLEELDQAYYSKAWHGTTLKGSLRGLRLKQVLWRPGKKRHNIWEIVLHCAYWKYAVRRRMTGEKQGSFPYKGSDWIELPEVLDTKNWHRTVSLLHDMHLLLRETVADLPPSKLEYVPVRAKVPNYITILGIASHDLYHTGQIQLIKKLMKK
ncbi:MAG: DinB family protein [candidate division Zixibacteria bacterium]|nr:DinB family protein [candidate division Zixibacteria bacterium]NIR64705.1 DinB family protein [candidate division Zixibacteria bacterium]NIS14938.1 DinB family protein [candidate division Zixibacteria bacterium]NIS46543.1 DinB family protein [candidate division Zixibacteria bacterium]NIT53377.1 DinB family protein [candidate division Zixibacteria bacterium]